MLSYSSVFGREKYKEGIKKYMSHLYVIGNVTPTMHWWHALWAINCTCHQQVKVIPSLVMFHIQLIPINVVPSSWGTLR